MTDPLKDEDLDRMLPFYANGTLNPADRERVEAALLQSPALRAALAEQREILELVRQGARDWAASGNGPGPVPEAGVPAPAGRISPLARALAALSPANWSPAVVLALALVALAQSAGLLVQGRSINRLQDENYQLANGQTPEAAKGAILVELKPDARWDDVAALLDKEELKISASADFGLLTVRTARVGAEFEALLTRLRASPLVASAEPAA